MACGLELKSGDNSCIEKYPNSVGEMDVGKKQDPVDVDYNYL